MYKRILLIVLVVCMVTSAVCAAYPKEIGATEKGTLFILTETIQEKDSEEIGAVSQVIYTQPNPSPYLKDFIGRQWVYVFSVKDETYRLVGFYSLVPALPGETMKLWHSMLHSNWYPIKENEEVQKVYKAVLEELKAREIEDEGSSQRDS